jgi:hypothetical protein
VLHHFAFWRAPFVPHSYQHNTVTLLAFLEVRVCMLWMFVIGSQCHFNLHSTWLLMLSYLVATCKSSAEVTLQVFFPPLYWVVSLFYNSVVGVLYIFYIHSSSYTFHKYFLLTLLPFVFQFFEESFKCWWNPLYQVFFSLCFFFFAVCILF